MFENDLAIFKIQTRIAMKERFYFIYTLIAPIIMVFLNKTEDFQDNEALYIYWSYIVVTTVFNGFLINLIRLRESGFFKTLTYLIGSKHSIVLANLLVQFLVIQLEIFLFNLIVTLFITHVSAVTFVYGFLVSFLSALLCSAMMSGLLLLKLRQGIFNLMISGFFIIGILLLGLRPHGLLNYVLTIINPFQLIYELYNIHCSSFREIIFLSVIASGYLLMGGMIFKGISIKSHLK
ncbi:hypothetical protein ACFQAV_03605 [Companilactobacillus huachuanensis]|uniref:ABC transporter permease n=1 Tax=Companilactobacillus huachuanensis TaxID=2559914 RepID=A0ABW1RIS4_9LACO|nr:hypothetical protein [Companilactobacillus huachuanensis]